VTAVEPVCTLPELNRLAQQCRAWGLDAAVEEGACRVRLPGSCYARPAPDGKILGWTAGDDLLWYGRFDTAERLVRAAHSARRLRWLANLGLGLIGIWIAIVTGTYFVPGLGSLPERVPLLYVAVFLLALVGGSVWLLARFLRSRLLRSAGGVVWLRGPLESRSAER